VGLVLAGGTLATGCGGTGTGDAMPKPREDVSVAVVIKGLDNPFFGTMRDGLVAAAARHRIALRVEAAADVNDAAGQASRLGAEAGQSTGCYIVSPINQTNLITPLSSVPKGTPIVNIDLPVDRHQAAALGVHITTFIATDNAAAGTAAAATMAGMLSRGARVAVLTGPSGDANSAARIGGFRAGSRGRFDIVASAAADWDRRKARRAAADILAADHHVDGIFAANDLMALGAVAAVRSAGRRGHVAVIGVDGIGEALDAVMHGDLSATVAQYPYTMGQLGVEACLAAARGRRVPARIDAPIEVVTKQNLARVRTSLPRPLRPFADPLGPLLAP
jgi:ribose transport system substrate-binding protein